MTIDYDELRVAPDPSQAEDLRQRLHARMARDWREEHPSRLAGDELVILTTDLSDHFDTSTRRDHRDRTHRRRLVTAAAAVVVVIATAGIIMGNRSSNDDPTVTVAPTPTGDQISVTPEFIQLGEGLVGEPRVVRADGRTYVVADHFDAADSPDNEPGEKLWWYRPERSVLAAFDDDGDELWRTELERPSQVAAAGGDVWFADDAWIPDDTGTLSRVDASNGRVVGRVNVGQHGVMAGAFGSVWVEVPASEGRARVIRVDPDLSTTTIELPERDLEGHFGASATGSPAVGPDAIWVPLGGGGVGVIDPDTNKVKVISAKEIGHAVTSIAFDGDATYVADDFEVTAIVDGKVSATVTTLMVAHMGSIDGVFGLVTERSAGRFQVLRPEHPMEVEARYISTDVPTESIIDIDGELWMTMGRNFSLRRVHLLP